MDRINEYEVYNLGKSLQQLASRRGPTLPMEIIWDVLNARNSIIRLINGEPVPIDVSKGPAEALFQSVDGLYIRHFSVESENGERKIQMPTANSPAVDDWEIEHYKYQLDRFETVFSEEMRAASAYFVPRRGIYSTTSLIDAADETFPVEIRLLIPDKTKQDWRSAGRCLAFNLLSATGFHVARAVEGTIEAYYQKFSGKNNALPSWNEYAKELENLARANNNPKPSDKTIAEIRQMKDDFRNPIMHPRVSLSEADARMLFANGESLIIAMAQEILQANTNDGVQTSLIDAFLPPKKEAS